MKIVVRETKKFILTLNQDEASWLKSYMQNGFPEEGGTDKKMRKLFWNLLTEEEGEKDGET